MFFQIDFSNGLAIYDQVVRQVKFAVAGGVLKEGDLVPSVRELARDLTINPNTVSRAYRQLQDDGVLNSVRGTGLAVATGASQRCREQRVELIRTRLEQVFLEARQSRLDQGKLRELVEQQLAEQVPSPAGRGLG
jgi:GntR family transcriptional regulator